MTVSEDQWSALEARSRHSTGVSWTRVAPGSERNLFIAVAQPGTRRCIWYELSSADVPSELQLPGLRSIRCRIRHKDDQFDITRIELELESADLNSVFRALVNDILSAVASAADDRAGLSILINRMERWRRLLQIEGSAGLTMLERRGLYGELEILTSLLDQGLSAASAVASWTGPFGQHQDFQAGKAALEVKSTVTKQPQALVITSERELDDVGVDQLFLVHVSLDERRGGSGQSLNDLVQAVVNQLEGTSAVSSFENALLHVGYLAEHEPLYREPRYTVREKASYQVLEGFPRLTERQLPKGVGDVRYQVQIAALQPFVTDHKSSLRLIGGV